MKERKRDGVGGAGENPAVFVGAVASVLQLVAKLAQLYRDLPSSAEIFSVISFNLGQ